MREDIIQDRKEIVAWLREQGIDPYPVGTKRTCTIGQVLSDFSSLSKNGNAVWIVGRVRSVRDQGNIMFCDLEDMSGRMQVVLKKQSLKKQFSLYKKGLGVGDFLQVKGIPFITKRKEKSVEATSLALLTKALRPLPTDFYGIEDIETRLRKRYLDTLTHQEVRDLFVKKSRFWSAMREFLNKEGFLEVDTPVLEETPGGAEAEPFVTHHNALDEDFYLRISLEISLKKIIVGGFEKVYEIGKVFRNEGIDAEHLQDYLQMEFYWAYADYKDLMKMLPKFYRHIIKSTTGGLTTEWNGTKIHWGKPWKKVDYVTWFREYTRLNPITASLTELRSCAKELGITIDNSLERGRLVDLIYKKTVRPTLIQPSFLINPPVFLEPLAKRDPNNPHVVERLQIVACGTELGKGFSEGNDPQDQRERFEQQMALREKGDKEAQMLDEDFLEALEYGMPPTAGFGLSERLFAMIMDKPIRETVFFPPMRRN